MNCTCVNVRTGDIAIGVKQYLFLALALPHQAQCLWQMSGIVVECQESRSGSTTSPPLNGQDVLSGLALHQAPSFN